jgi:hypothetical protein
MRFDTLGNVMEDRICVRVIFYASVCVRLRENGRWAGEVVALCDGQNIRTLPRT